MTVDREIVQLSPAQADTMALFLYEDEGGRAAYYGETVVAWALVEVTHDRRYIRDVEQERLVIGVSVDADGSASANLVDEDLGRGPFWRYRMPTNDAEPTQDEVSRAWADHLRLQESLRLRAEALRERGIEA